MKNLSPLFFVGILIAVVPFLGFPTSWRNIFLVCIGVWMCGHSFTHTKKVSRRGGHRHATSNTFVESYVAGQNSGQHVTDVMNSHDDQTT